jgi:integron integrase
MKTIPRIIPFHIDSRKNDTIIARPPKLLDQVRHALRTRHYSYATEKTYIQWIKQYVYFHNITHPKDLGEEHISQFLTHLAVKKKVSASTQNQALCALVFLYKNVLEKDLAEFDSIVWAKKPVHLPVVLSRIEVKTILEQLKGTPWILSQLLYGSGLRLKEALRLRVKDIDFAYHQIHIWEAKGAKSRVTLLPKIVEQPLKVHLERVQKIHQKDLTNGYGEVELPYALTQKYKHAAREWHWQYVFPASHISSDPRSGIRRRHHLDESVLRKALRKAVQKTGIVKHVTSHTFRHSFATHLPCEISGIY